MTKHALSARIILRLRHRRAAAIARSPQQLAAPFHNSAYRLNPRGSFTSRNSDEPALADSTHGAQHDQPGFFSHSTGAVGVSAGFKPKGFRRIQGLTIGSGEEISNVRAGSRSRSSNGPAEGGPTPPRPGLPDGFRNKYLTSPPPAGATGGADSGDGQSPDAEGEGSSFHARNLAKHLRVSFLPSHQPYESSGDEVRHGALAGPSHSHEAEAAIALVCPIEGGEGTVRRTVDEAAAAVGADVVRIDVIRCFAFGEWGELGPAGASFRLGTSNPVLVKDRDDPANLAAEDEPSSSAEENRHESEEDSEDPHSDEAHFISGPIEIAMPFGGMSGGGGGGGGGPGGLIPVNMGMHGARAAIEGQNRDVQAMEGIFDDIVNLSEAAGDAEPGSTRPRIVLVEHATAMMPSFEKWWTGLAKAVRKRRQRSVEGETITRPTTIILGCTPSLLKTGPNLSAERDEAANAPANEMPQMGMGMSISMSPGLADILKAMGRSPEGGKSKEEDELWMGSEETDALGRKRRLRRRLTYMQAGDERGLRKLIPAFDETSKTDEDGQQGPFVGVQALMSRMGGMRSSNKNDSTPYGPGQRLATRIWKVLGTLPAKRDDKAEKQQRHALRMDINRLLLKKSVGLHGLEFASGELSEVLNTDEPMDADVVQEIQDLRDSFAASVWPWTTISHLGTISVADALTQTGRAGALKEVSWVDVARASHEEDVGDRAMQKWKEANKAAEPVQSANVQPQPRTRRNGGSSKGKDKKEKGVDQVVEKLKKDRTLNQHEKRLLSCIVDPRRVAATTFEDVAMAEQTKDAVRSTISLPLLYPEAFQHGVLAQHASQGVLLYGPPGTGKTHLSRALANESGSRMIAVTPADINDMYVGQSEARTKALFTLARRLSPCIIFIDEAESMLGSRGGYSGSNAAHRQVLTEFMQEMDGLTSAASNKDARISVVAATNRPFDMDEAVLRRLPRRLLIDLPTVVDREAILRILLKDEKLGNDVDIGDLASKTKTYSGSDLKNLCVNAAMAALKESLPLPWLAGKGAGVGTTNPLTTPPPTGGSALEPQEELLDAEVAEPAETTQPQALPQASLQLESKESSDTASGEEIAGASKAREADLSEAAVSGETSLKTPTSDQGDVPSGDAARAGRPRLAERILQGKHFEIALKEITPSSAEGGNLEELRKWAEKFGEGGTERGKKAGYGGRFGFGEAGDKATVDPEYGRVRPENNDKTGA